MEKGFNIIGISIKTTNQNGQAKQDLEKLWKQFFSENIISKIPNKLSNDIFSIYTDYKSDFTEEYLAIIGIQVTDLKNIPDGLIGRYFKPETFKKYIAKGEIPNSVANSWTEIWKNDHHLNRKYTYDFELYSDKSNNGKNSEVEIYIAIS
jgi:predicted transcriptional regulator YdeE